MLFAYLTLATALIISISAAYYSILGLTAIFAAAFWPIVILGSSLEVGKIVSTLWLHKYWNRAEVQYKLYLCTAVAVLMFLTSMGVFGFLSKAHSDQSLVSGDVTSKIAIYDEKIKQSRDNITAARSALKQMDESVDQTMSRSTDEKGADKAAQLRRGQAGERNRLLKEIDNEQKKIQSLNDERAPIAAEVRKVEAEVGPIKYIAALVYGDNPDANLLEKAVRWVIILIVIVFDPLALTLLLAATKAIEWERGINVFAPRQKKPKEDQEIIDLFEGKDNENDEVKKWFNNARERARFWDNQEKPQEEKPQEEKPKETDTPPQVEKENVVTIDYNNQEHIEMIRSIKPDWKPPVEQTEKEKISSEPSAPGWMFTKPTGDITSPNHFGKSTEETPVVEESKPMEEPVVELPVEVVEETKPETVADTVTVISTDEIDPMTDMAKLVMATENSSTNVAEKESLIDSLPISDSERKRLKEMASLSLQPDNVPAPSGNVTGFGISFPNDPVRGDMFLRVDQLPTQLYKFNGAQWILVDKNITDTYVYDEAYIDHLIEKISTGEYDLDLLSDAEREQIESRLKQMGN
jgi:hypothetical protein